jgi:archaellin
MKFILVAAAFASLAIAAAGAMEMKGVYPPPEIVSEAVIFADTH